MTSAVTDELRAAYERLRQWRWSPGASRVLSITSLDSRRGVLRIGSEQEVPKKTRDEILRVIGDVPAEFIHATFKPHQPGNTLIRPLVGGIEIYAFEVEVGSLGLVVTGPNQQQGFLTCGHILGDIGNVVYQPESTDDADIVGSVTANGMSLNPPIDAGFIVLNQGIAATQDAVWQDNGVLNVTGTMNVPVIGDNCVMIGAVSGTVGGEVLDTNIDTGQATCLASASYSSQDGDSGGPVLALADDDSLILIGVHSGGGMMGDQEISLFTQVQGIVQVVSFTL